mmetsp:Transcript_53562/g.154439  ORF Transcript_53562/g.154439 Transcript_53562/m.154439 type:complete len:611 (+) Transcript_53562:1931-3763(+)
MLGDEADRLRHATGLHRRPPRQEPLGPADGRRAQGGHPLHRSGAVCDWLDDREGGDPLRRPRLADLGVGWGARPLIAAVRARHIAHHLLHHPLRAERLPLPQDGQERRLGPRRPDDDHYRHDAQLAPLGPRRLGDARTLGARVRPSAETIGGERGLGMVRLPSSGIAAESLHTLVGRAGIRAELVLGGRLCSAGHLPCADLRVPAHIRGLQGVRRHQHVAARGPRWHLHRQCFKIGRALLSQHRLVGAVPSLALASDEDATSRQRRGVEGYGGGLERAVAQGPRVPRAVARRRRERPEPPADRRDAPRRRLAAAELRAGGVLGRWRRAHAAGGIGGRLLRHLSPHAGRLHRGPRLRAAASGGRRHEAPWVAGPHAEHRHRRPQDLVGARGEVPRLREAREAMGGQGAAIRRLGGGERHSLPLEGLLGLAGCRRRRHPHRRGLAARGLRRRVALGACARRSRLAGRVRVCGQASCALPRRPHRAYERPCSRGAIHRSRPRRRGGDDRPHPRRHVPLRPRQRPRDDLWGCAAALHRLGASRGRRHRRRGGRRGHGERGQRIPVVLAVERGLGGAADADHGRGGDARDSAGMDRRSSGRLRPCSAGRVDGGRV